MPVLNQRQRVEFFPWQAVNQQNAPLNQRKIAEVGSGKPSNGAGWRAVNQLNQLNQHYFCLLSEKNRDWPREVSMAAQISAYGRLVADPETRITGKGTSMAMARLAVSLPCNAAADGQATFWLGVIAFGKQADALAKHHKSDLVSVAGQYADQSEDGPEWRHPAGLPGTGRQCDQRQNSLPRRQTGAAGASNRRATSCAAATGPAGL
ncbi:single-stranded DNA-binding protein [Klebsiella pneumoniae]|nr:single-stranded DNA-binding protein [Klebsiella pneumoniae]SWG60984.1 single-stranded DNA-binding protein [Klebsiella pneumoniae]